MPNLIFENSHRILGLPISASATDLVKRSKEIIHSLAINRFVTFDKDFLIPEQLRTKESVKIAVQNLQVPATQLNQAFFWFNILTESDEKAYAFLCREDFENAILTWEKASNSSSGAAYNSRKNLSIMLCLLLELDNNLEYLLKSIFNWHKVVNSERFWDAFQKFSNLKFGIHTANMIPSFRENIISHLADNYMRLYQIYRDPFYISKFNETFSIGNSRAVAVILDPISKNIHSSIENLELMGISDDGVYDENEKDKVLEIINELKDSMHKLKDLNLYDDSRVKIMRDRIAAAIRSIVLDLHNNLAETSHAISLLKFANTIVGTAGEKLKISNEIKLLMKIRANNNLLSPVSELMNSEKWENALASLESIEIAIIEEAGVEKILDEYKAICIIKIAGSEFNRITDIMQHSEGEALDEMRISAERIIMLLSKGKVLVPTDRLFNLNGVLAVLKEKNTELLKPVELSGISLASLIRDNFIKILKDNNVDDITMVANLYYFDAKMILALPRRNIISESPISSLNKKSGCMGLFKMSLFRISNYMANKLAR